MELEKIFQNLGIGGDIAETLSVVLFLLALSVLFWFLIGRFRLHNFLINTYISLAIVSVIPQSLVSLSDNSRAMVFMIVATLLTLMNRYIFDIHQSGSGLAIWQVVVMSFLELMLFLSIILSFLPNYELPKYISNASLEYLTDPRWLLAWMILPLVFLALVKKRGLERRDKRFPCSLEGLPNSIDLI